MSPPPAPAAASPPLSDAAAKRWGCVWEGAGGVQPPTGGDGKGAVGTHRGAGCRQGCGGQLVDDAGAREQCGAQPVVCGRRGRPPCPALPDPALAGCGPRFPPGSTLLGGRTPLTQLDGDDAAVQGGAEVTDHLVEGGRRGLIGLGGDRAGILGAVATWGGCAGILGAVATWGGQVATQAAGKVGVHRQPQQLLGFAPLRSERCWQGTREGRRGPSRPQAPVSLGGLLPTPLPLRHPLTPSLGSLRPSKANSELLVGDGTEPEKGEWGKSPSRGSRRASRNSGTSGSITQAQGQVGATGVPGGSPRGWVLWVLLLSDPGEGRWDPLPAPVPRFPPHHPLELFGVAPVAHLGRPVLQPPPPWGCAPGSPVSWANPAKSHPRSHTKGRTPRPRCSSGDTEDPVELPEKTELRLLRYRETATSGSAGEPVTRHRSRGSVPYSSRWLQTQTRTRFPPGFPSRERGTGSALTRRVFPGSFVFYWLLRASISGTVGGFCVSIG